MEHLNASEMIAEIKQRQAKLIEDDDLTAGSRTQFLVELSLDLITEEEITSEALKPVLEPANLINLTTIKDYKESSLTVKSTYGKFNDEGKQAILHAKAEDKLVEFAATLPSLRERLKLLSEGSRVNNADTWTKYVYRTAYNISENKKLEAGFQVFKQQVSSYLSNPKGLNPPSDLHSYSRNSPILWDRKAKEYSQILDQLYLSTESFNRAFDILNELKNNGRLDMEKYQICLEELRNLQS